MILPGFPTLLKPKPSSAITFPAVTLNRANINTSGMLGYNSYGYIRSGGPTASAFGVSGGSISGTLVPGFVMDAVVDYSNGNQISISIEGNCEAQLGGITALMDNGTPLPLDEPFAYDSGSGITGAFTASGNGWSATGNRTIQLV